MKSPGARRGKPKTPAKRTKPSKGGLFSARNIAKRLHDQKAAATLARKLKSQEKQARADVAAFRARKSDRGKFVMIGNGGKRNPQNRGKRGRLVYVTKTGKKLLFKHRKSKEPFKARQIADLYLPPWPDKQKKFQRARLLTLQHKLRSRKDSKSFKGKDFTAIGERLKREGDKKAEKAFKAKNLGKRGYVKAEGSTQTGGSSEFSDSVVDEISNSLIEAAELQRGKQVFQVSILMLVKLPDGTTEVLQTTMPFGYQDFQVMKSRGVEWFVRGKFYATMARELAIHGYVTQGSANHIRGRKANRGKNRDEWLGTDGNKWQGANKDEVELLTIEWKIEQSSN